MLALPPGPGSDRPVLRVWPLADGRVVGLAVDDGAATTFRFVAWDATGGAAVLGRSTGNPLAGPHEVEVSPRGDVFIERGAVYRFGAGWRVLFHDMETDGATGSRAVGFAACGDEVVGLVWTGRVTRWPVPVDEQPWGVRPAAEGRAVFERNRSRHYGTAAVSPDATRVAVVNHDSRVLVAAVTRGAALGFPAPGADRDTRLTFAPDNRTLAASRAGRVRLIDLHTRRAADLPEPVVALAFTPDSRRVVAAHADGTVGVWESPAGTLVARFDWSELAGPVSCVCVAADGLTACAGGTLGRAVRWDLPG